MIISNRNRRILYLSKVHVGKAHDYSILKAEFPPELCWFEKKTVRVDLGFQGFGDLYTCKQLFIPVKKKRKQKGVSNELSDADKEANKAMGAARIYVEHAIGGMKRFRILEYRNRIKGNNIINTVIGVCAGLWNLFLT